MTHKTMRHKLAQGMRKDPTEAERILWVHLRRCQLKGYRFRRQTPLGRYIADFVCLEKRLVVELDGQYHLSADQTAYDQIRDEWMLQQNFQVLRFWNSEVVSDVQGVLQRIQQRLDQNYGAKS